MSPLQKEFLDLIEEEVNRRVAKKLADMALYVKINGTMVDVERIVRGDNEATCEIETPFSYNSAMDTYCQKNPGEMDRLIAEQMVEGVA